MDAPKGTFYHLIQGAQRFAINNEELLTNEFTGGLLIRGLPVRTWLIGRHVEYSQDIRGTLRCPPG